MYRLVACILQILMILGLAAGADTTRSEVPASPGDAVAGKTVVMKDAGTIPNENSKVGDTLQSLADIYVEDRSIEEKLKSGPVAVSVIDGKEIRGRAASLEDVLNKVPGVSIRSTGGLGSISNVSVYGQEGQRVQIFLEDFPVNAPDGSFSINDVPVDLIERVEIYKGVVPARFGSDGIGGVVNIVVREFTTDYIDLSYAHGSYNTNNATWVLKKMLNKPGILIGTGGFFNYSDNDYTFENPFNPGETVERDHDRYRSFVTALNAEFTKLWFDKLKVGVDYYTNWSEIQGIQKPVLYAERKTDAFIIEANAQKEGFFLDDLDFMYNLSAPLMTMNLLDTAGNGEIDNFSRHNSDDHVNELRQRLNLDYHITDEHNVNFNTIFRYSCKEYNDPPASEMAGYDLSAYPAEMYSVVTGLTYETSLFKGNLLNALGAKAFYFNSELVGSKGMGGRVLGDPAYKTNSSRNFGFSEAIRWRFLEYFNLKASYQRTFRLPTPEELFGDGLSVTASPELKPEKGNNVNAGIFIDADNALCLHRIQFEINGFMTDVKDMIKLANGAMTEGYENLDHVFTRGVEAELRLDITPHLYTYANGTILDSRDAQKIDPITSTANPTYNKKVPDQPWLYSNFGIELHRGKLIGKTSYSKVFWDVRFTEEYFYDWEMTTRDKRRIPRSFIHDAGVQHAMKDNRFIIGAEIHNILDATRLDVFQKPLEGRSFHLKVRMSIIGK